jgi:hypothetical protein
MGVMLLVFGTDNDRAVRLATGETAAGVVRRLNIGLDALIGVPS